MGSSSKTTNSSANATQTTTPNAPSWVSSSLGNYNTMVQNLASQNPSSFVAGPSSNQNAAFTTAMNTLDSTSPNYGTATNLEAGNSTIDPTQSSSIADFMNPYTSNVVNTTQNQMNLENAQAVDALQGQAAASDAFGGSNYTAGLGSFLANTNASDAAQIAALESSGYNGAVSNALSNAQLGQTAGTNTAAIGTEQAAANDANLQTQAGIGATQQQLAQSAATAPISLAQTIGSLDSMGQYGLLTGSTTNGATNSTSTTTTDPSLLSDLTSLPSALAGLGSASSLAGAATGGLAGLFGASYVPSF